MHPKQHFLIIEKDETPVVKGVSFHLATHGSISRQEGPHKATVPLIHLVKNKTFFLSSIFFTFPVIEF